MGLVPNWLTSALLIACPGLYIEQKTGGRAPATKTILLLMNTSVYCAPVVRLSPILPSATHTCSLTPPHLSVCCSSKQGDYSRCRETAPACQMTRPALSTHPPPGLHQYNQPQPGLSLVSLCNLWWSRLTNILYTSSSFLSLLCTMVPLGHAGGREV